MTTAANFLADSAANSLAAWELSAKIAKAAIRRFFAETPDFQAIDVTNHKAGTFETIETPHPTVGGSIEVTLVRVEATGVVSTSGKHTSYEEMEAVDAICFVQYLKELVTK